MVKKISNLNMYPIKVNIPVKDYTDSDEYSHIQKFLPLLIVKSFKKYFTLINDFFMNLYINFNISQQQHRRKPYSGMGCYAQYTFVKKK